MTKRPVKIATIGGGSSYTPELVEGFIKRYDELPIKELWLVDIEEGKEKLEIVGAMAQRMVKAAGVPMTIHLTLDREEALKDADFVTTQFRVGLLDARIKDERIPLSHGIIGQETNGAGGMFKAFRTVPVILEIVEDMKRLCPNAWLVNFTNPSGMVTEAVIKYGKWDKVVGLCNVPISCRKMVGKALDKNEEELFFKFAGLNHFHWHRVWDVDGTELTDKAIQKLYVENDGLRKFGANATRAKEEEEKAAKRAADAGVANIKNISFVAEQIQDLGYLPCMYHRYYYITDDMLEDEIADFKENGTRAEVVKRTEAELFELYKDPNLNIKPKQLEQRGGQYYSDAACELINSIYNDKGTVIVVSTKNNGVIDCLPDNCAVEVTARVYKDGIKPFPQDPFPKEARGILQLMKCFEEMTIEAAVTGDYNKAIHALTLNPLVNSGHQVKVMFDEIIRENWDYLPQFHHAIKREKY